MQKSYSRTIRFARIGLHTNPDPLTVDVTVKNSSVAPYPAGPSMGTQIEKYARRFLDHDGTVNVSAHPDQRHGRITADGGMVLAEFTVHLVTEEPPAVEVDLSDITAVVETAVHDPQRVLGVTRCRTGAVVRVHAYYTQAVADVLAATGYTVHLVEGVLLVSLDPS